ncbi:hypothetical protein VIGAN_UM189600, partial [Vigna angularis var. angularis]
MSRIKVSTIVCFSPGSQFLLRPNIYISICSSFGIVANNITILCSSPRRQFLLGHKICIPICYSFNSIIIIVVKIIITII